MAHEVVFKSFAKTAVSKIRNAQNQRATSIAMFLHGEVQKKITGPRTGRRYRVPGTQVSYTASAPGEPPAKQLGDLGRSTAWRVEPTVGGFDSIVGSDSPYARRLEFGFKGRDSLGRVYNMAPRPWLRRTFREQLEEIKRRAKGTWF